jgi:S1-C subfamily serine protease
MLRAPFTALLGLALLPALPAVAADVEKPAAALSLLRQIDEGFVQLFEKVAPAVVVIEATKKNQDPEEGDEIRSFEYFFKEGEGRKESTDEKGEPRTWRLPQGPTRSEGSGFILRADGYVLTNYHVVAEAEKLDVRLRDGRVLPAKLIGSDDRTDIAVLKVESKDLPVAQMGNSDTLRVGQLVGAIGAPFSQDYSFTCGWVSGKGRSNLLEPTSPIILIEDYIQTDAFINPGNSGGPLFDVDGEVIGMNTLINGIGRGLAFAIPSNILMDVAAQLIATGKMQHPWLGIRIETLGATPALRERLSGIDKGVVVDTIEANAPAYKSDLRPADVITEVDGVKLATARDLRREILRKKVGQTVQLTVWRSGVVVRVPVVTGELPTELTRVANQSPQKASASPESKAGVLGLKLKDAKPSGAAVTEVAPGSPAAKADLQADDVITAVESKPVGNAAACLTAINSATAGKPGEKKKGVMLNIERKGKRTYAVLPE